MPGHATRTEMERFCALTLETAEMIALSDHMTDCAACRRLHQEVFDAGRNYAPLVIDLAPEAWLKDLHLDYESLVAWVDRAMDAEETEMTQIHLRLCRRCREDVEDFSAWLKEIEPELKIRYLPDARSDEPEKISGWSWPVWRPAYAFGLLLVFGLLLTAALMFFRSGSGGRKQTRTDDLIKASPVPVRPLVSPSASVVTTRTPEVRTTPRSETEQKHAGALDAEPLIALNDQSQRIVIDHAGRLRGLENLPPELRRSVREYLLAENIRRPETMAELAGVSGDQRGTNTPSSFKLIFPASIVIAEARPTFRWEAVNGASGYQVYISDPYYRRIVRSGMLDATATEWTPAAPLRRGETYSWVVSAMVSGEEILAPSASEREVKFIVLAEEKLRTLKRLRSGAQSRLALGVFYSRAGMLAEAEREFQMLVDENPDSPVARRLLRAVRSWR